MRRFRECPFLPWRSTLLRARDAFLMSGASSFFVVAEIGP
jgi:hypothetical protein